jgi:hypothetical protein
VNENVSNDEPAKKKKKRSRRSSSNKRMSFGVVQTRVFDSTGNTVDLAHMPMQQGQGSPSAAVPVQADSEGVELKEEASVPVEAVVDQLAGLLDSPTNVCSVTVFVFVLYSYARTHTYTHTLSLSHP